MTITADKLTKHISSLVMTHMNRAKGNNVEAWAAMSEEMYDKADQLFELITHYKHGPALVKAWYDKINEEVATAAAKAQKAKGRSHMPAANGQGALAPSARQQTTGAGHIQDASTGHSSSAGSGRSAPN